MNIFQRTFDSGFGILPAGTLPKGTVTDLSLLIDMESMESG